MADLAPFAWAMLVAAAVIVGLSKTAIPGAAALAVAMFAAVLPARSSTAALLLLLIVGDVLALTLYRRHADWATLLRLAPSVIGGVVIGAVVLALADDGMVRRVIGVILLIMVAVTLWLRRPSVRPTEPREDGRGALVGYGTLGGFTTMVANAGGPVMSLYFLAAKFDVRSFLGTAAWFFAIVNLTKLPITIGLGLLSWQVVVMDLLLAPAVIVGGALGWFVARRLTQSVFDVIVLVLTAATALFLLLGPA